MKKILVPVSFTDASRSGMHYAEALARQIKAEIVVLNVQENQGVDAIQTIQKLNRFIKDAPDRITGEDAIPAPVKSLVKKGNIVTEILAVAKAENVDLIVVGTRHKHQFKDYLLGSVSTQLFQKTTLPVLVVPERCSFIPISNITFASDIIADHDETPGQISAFAKSLGASLEKLYVNPLPNDFSEAKMSIIPQEEPSAYKRLIVVRDSFIFRGIEHYLNENESELVTIYIKDRTMFQNWMHQHIVKQMIFEGHTPILVLHERKIQA